MGYFYNPVINMLGAPGIWEAPLGDRPPFGIVGRIFIDTDIPSTGIYRDTGGGWELISGGGGGGNVSTAGGTTDTLAMFTGPTDIGDSPISYNPVGPLDHLLSTKALRLQAGTDISFVKLLTKINSVNQIAAAFDLSPVAVPYKLVVIDNGANYITVQSVFTTPLVHFRSDAINGTVRIEQNGTNGLIESLATLVRVSNKFKTGSPDSAGAGEIKIGKFNLGAAPITALAGYVTIELDGKLTYLNGSQEP